MAINVPSFLIAAARKSSGKTTISLGLTRAFANRGLRVQTYKKGPDYIDPLWLSQASNSTCFNLDFNTQNNTEIVATYCQNLHGADLGIVESNKGLFDGVDVFGSDSNAQLVKLLKTPVILVIDTIGMTRGIAPLLLGYENFDPDISIAGVILNKTGGERHERKLRAAVEHYTDICVLGAVRRDDNLIVSERHLGLTTPGEKSNADPLIEILAERIEDSLDLAKILNIARRASTCVARAGALGSLPIKNSIKIAVARDAAFGFYYEDDLVALKNAGAKLEFFSPLSDEKLPEADALFFGGGFPETNLKQLARNKSMLAQIKSEILRGKPTYAECGGLMYLSRTIHWRGESERMVGAIPGDCRMHEKPQGRGFAKLKPTALHPWQFDPGSTLNVHEFHYSDITNLPADTKYAYQVSRGHGIDGKRDGIVINNLLANFCHFRSTTRTPWVNGFVEFTRQMKDANQT